MHHRLSGFLLLILSLSIAGLCIHLGRWQWQKGVIKQQRIAQFSQRHQHPPYTLSQWEATAHTSPHDTQRYYTAITVKGHFDTAHFFLIDNQFLQHQLGYFLLVPFRPNDVHHRAFLVNTGWIARKEGKRLQKLSHLVSDKTQTVLGLLYFPPRNPFLLDKRGLPQGEGGMLAEAIQMPAFAQALPYPISAWLLLWDTPSSPTLIRKWMPTFSVSPQRHRAYALQWFSFALIAVCGALIFMFKKDKGE